MTKHDLVPKRCESPCIDHRESEFLCTNENVYDYIIVHQRRRCQSQLSVGEHARSAAQQNFLPACNNKSSIIILFILLLF
jgi:hypothetical protein